MTRRRDQRRQSEPPETARPDSVPPEPEADDTDPAILEPTLNPPPSSPNSADELIGDDPDEAVPGDDIDPASEEETDQ